MGLYELARRVNARRKAYLKQRAGTVLSPVRRIERVHPVHGRRLVAMTFDDGPDALGVEGRGKGLTEVLLDSLSEYGARVTFDVIGDTSPNYPDEKGDDGTFLWSGRAFDHYPEFGCDELAGAKNQPELTARILREGHELANHGSTHRLFGPMRAVYGERRHFDTLQEVVADLQDLHSFLQDRLGYNMRLGRPAHYIDRIPDGSTAYDAYRIMGYNYVAASFDGAGWQPLSSYEKEVEAMVKPLQLALEQNPEALNGSVIFQKDGCNMARRTPIIDALPQQLALLREYGYEVVPVSELLEMSPFEDLEPETPEAEAARFLLARGHVVGYRNNTFHGERAITVDEVYLTLASPELLRTPRRLTQRELVELARSSAGVSIGSASGNSLLALAEHSGVEGSPALKDRYSVTRRDAMPLLAEIVRSAGT